MKNKVCFIGSNGFVAQSFGRFFNEEINPIIPDVFGTSKPQSYLFNQFFQIDLCKSLPDIEQLKGYDTIFYFSAIGVQSGGDYNPLDIYRVNAFVPIELLSLLQSVGYTGNFITFGSYFEIGFNDLAKRFNEEEVIYAHSKVPNNYCISKRLLSRYIDTVQLTFNHYHFILPSVFGIFEKKSRLIPHILFTGKKNQPINLTSGEQVRQYLNIVDAFKIINQVIEQKLAGGCYNIGSNLILSIKELTLLIFETLNLNKGLLNFGSLNRTDAEMKMLMLDDTKLMNLNIQITESNFEQFILNFYNEF